MLKTGDWHRKAHHKQPKTKPSNIPLSEAFDLTKLKSLVDKDGAIRAVSISGDRHAYIMTFLPTAGFGFIVTYEIWTDCLGAHLGRADNQPRSNPIAKELIMSCFNQPVQSRLEMQNSY